MASRVETKNISLGLGILEFGDFTADAFVAYRDVGAIKTTLNLTLTREISGFETGRPLVMVKHEVIRETAQLAATLAEITAANLKSALGGGVLSSSVTPTFLDGTAVAPKGDLTDSNTAVGISDITKFGGQCDLNRLAIRFTHLKSCTSGKRHVLEIYRAIPTGTLTLPFSETDWNQFEVTFECHADTTRPAGEQILQFVNERE
jgi:hypothetical protein